MPASRRQLTPTPGGRCHSLLWNGPFGGPIRAVRQGYIALEGFACDSCHDCLPPLPDGGRGRRKESKSGFKPPAHAPPGWLYMFFFVPLHPNSCMRTAIGRSNRCPYARSFCCIKFVNNRLKYCFIGWMQGKCYCCRP